MDINMLENSNLKANKILSNTQLLESIPFYIFFVDDNPKVWNKSFTSFQRLFFTFYLA